MVAPLAAGLIGAGVAGVAAGGLGALLAPSGKVNQSAIANTRGMIDAGGIRTGLGRENRSVDVHVDPSRTGLVTGLADVFRSRAGELGGMREQLTPGFGALTKARRANLQAAERQALGDLRSNLGRRRVLGSSFAADRESAIKEQFGRAGAELDAQSFLEELNADMQIFQQQSAAEAAVLETQLNELNLQTQIATGILSGSQAAIGQMENTSMQLKQALFQDLFGTATAGFGLLGQGGGRAIAGGSGGGTTAAARPISGWTQTLA